MQIPRIGSAVLALAVAGGAACASTPASPQGRSGALAWVEVETLLMAEPSTDEQLARWERGSVHDRVRRLDFLLDLFDAARFGDAAGPREAFWSALGGHRSGRGAAATRDASARLLDEALRIEERTDFAALPSDGRRFVADAIMLLTNDLASPATAEELATYALALRQLAAQGHSRIADNAQWRLYDHVRGTLQGAVQAPPRARYDIALQALYARHVDLADLLSDAPPTHAPRKPSPEALVQLMEVHLAALERLPAWAEIVAMRRREDAALRDTVLERLPVARADDWRLPELPPATGHAEIGAPVLLADARGVTVDAGRPTAQSFAWSSFDAERVARAIAAMTAADGRGAAFVAADPELPAPELAALLRAIRRSQLGLVELGARAPHAREPRSVVVGLPMHVVREADAGIGARALRDARLHVHLSGFGPRLTVDGRGVGSDAADPPWQRTAEAFPRERTVLLTLDDDVGVPQLAEVLSALVGGSQPLFEAVAWWAGGELPAETSQSPSLLDARVRWRKTPLVLDQPYPLREEDQRRLEAASERVSSCLPELEHANARKPVVIEVQFDAHRVVKTAVVRAPGNDAGRTSLERCLQAELSGVILHEHAERLTVRFATGAPSQGGERAATGAKPRGGAAAAPRDTAP